MNQNTLTCRASFSFHLPYVPVAWLLAVVVLATSASGRATHPLERPTAHSLSFLGSLDDPVKGANAAKGAGDKGAKAAAGAGDKGAEAAAGAGEGAQDKGAQAAATAGEEAKDAAKIMGADTDGAGEDPAATLEREAAGEVPETLPPKTEMRDKEAEEQGKTAAELTGVKPNNHGDFATFSVSLSVNALVVLVAVLSMSGLRLKFPMVYSGNVLSGLAPLTPDPGFLGWIGASLSTTTAQAANTVGLDAAMLLEYFNMCCKILAIISIPTVFIMCPLHYLFGGGGLPLFEISSIAMGNVRMRHPWLYYVHAFLVNFVTFAIVHVIYGTMGKFLDLRYAWLKNLPAPRCVTVLVEGIPTQWRSDARLKEFFSAMFHPDHIKDAVMVKNAPELEKLYNQQKELRDALANAKDEWELVNNDPEQRPMMREGMSCIGPKTDAISYYEKKLEELDPQVEEAREQARKEAENVGGINTSTGFVTYNHRRNTSVCMNTTFSTKRDEWIVSAPPPASDVLWADLKKDGHQSQAGNTVTYMIVFFLYLAFIPIVVIGTNLTALVDLGYFQPIWASFAPGLALMLCLAFLPTILLLIFRSFFTLKSDCFAQHKLQIWYFFFQLFFVLLVTTVGRSLRQTFTDVVRRPELIMELMAEHMPHSTHFYMDFLMLQWGEQAINFIRQVNLAKFIFFGFFHEPETAKDLSEPEDQDYYGMGARSARFTINMLIGITFCTLSPLIGVLCLCLFALCRLLYGYLIVYAETKKPDLGGCFFFTMLQHILIGTGLYNVLMIGVLSPSPIGRARSMMPSLISLPSLIYTAYCYKHFSHCFVWMELPFTEVTFHQKEMKAEDNGLRYMQPEFIDDEMEAEIMENASKLDAKAAKEKKSLKKMGAHLECPGGKIASAGDAANPHFLGADGGSLHHHDRDARHD